VKAMVRRLARLEDRLIPREDANPSSYASAFAGLASGCNPWGQPLPSPLVYDGPPLSLRERILLARRNHK
jgi:hypothetical protein